MRHLNMSVFLNSLKLPFTNNCFSDIMNLGDSMVIEVLVELKMKGIDQTFSYHVPKSFQDLIEVGKRVTVPFGHQVLEGFILKIEQEKKVDYELKDIISIVDDHPVLNEEMLELGHYMKESTLSNLISCYQTMLPTALKAHKDFNISKKYISYLIIKKHEKVSSKQQEILDLFENKNKVLKKEAQAISTSSVKTLLEKGILEEVKEEVYRLEDTIKQEKSTIILNDEQKNAVDKVVKSFNTFHPFLLHGVTGSGKTEVYMHIIEKVVKQKKEALVLVPEISLTPQLVSNFKKRFGSTIAILHSALSDGEKYDEWRKIERKEVSIVIGARSAIFAPLTNLGIIIIDEEHSSTYKQESNPRYNAIDLALYRAKHYECPVVLGSATPQIESYTRAQAGIYTLIELKNRVNHTFPKVTLVDMKEEIKAGYSLFSKLLQEKIEDRLQKGEQVLILLNRRGYSTVVTCHNCGYKVTCPNCDIPLTYHKTYYRMNCHYCGYTAPKPFVCPECKSKDINEFGIGTEKLEEKVKEKFQARVIRMDVDTTSKKGAHQKIIKAFENHEYDILIGTQMIAKGLDFSNVTLVGVLNGDASLNIPDFRSGERTFQLLSQVAGRAGRSSLKGEVVIQGFNMDHYSIIKAKEHDYLGFYQEEMKIRKALKYPPFYNLSLIRLSGKDFDLLMEEADKVSSYLKKSLDSICSILGPSSASVPKINQIFYVQIILKYKKSSPVKKELKFLLERYKGNRKIQVEIDRNPIKI